jgi:hypothetical protein
MFMKVYFSGVYGHEATKTRSVAETTPQAWLKNLPTNVNQLNLDLHFSFFIFHS